MVFNEDTTINSHGDKQFDLTESVFVVSGIINVLEKWIADDFHPSRDSIAEMMNTIILKVNRKQLP